ncbi:MAG: hypothetical protein U1F42_02705 [Candidatus Competibacteraceae bacterium]
MAHFSSSHFTKSISSELLRLCQESRTGTLFIVTTNSLLIQFSLDDGEIIFMAFQNRQGLEALTLLRQQQADEVAVFRFVEGKLPKNRLALPPTRQILEQLEIPLDPPPKASEPKSGRSGRVLTDLRSGRPLVEPKSGRELVDPISVAGQKSAQRMLTDQDKVVLKQELAEFIGPIAMIFCEDAWRSIHDLETALLTLSRELSDPNQVAHFRRNVLKRLS